MRYIKIFERLFISKSNIDGEGLFSTNDISSGKIICQIADLQKFDNTEKWINEWGHKINHSNTPTAEVEIIGNKCFIKAIEHISPDEEITTDYKTIPDFFNKSFNESVLEPDNYFHVDISNVNSIEDLSQKLSLKSIFITPVEEVDKKYGSKFSSRPNICGVYGGFITFKDKKNIKDPIIVIPIDESIVKDNLKDKKLFQILNNTIDHEAVHLSQYRKAGYIYYRYNGLYHDNPREAMAYAKTASNKLLELFDKDECLNFLRYGANKITHEQIAFSKAKPKSYNRFLKYLYQYLKNN